MDTSRSTAPIFIVGYMHSGTTLLHSILRANPAVYRAAYETKYFEYAPTVRHAYPDLDRSGPLDPLHQISAQFAVFAIHKAAFPHPPQQQQAVQSAEQRRPGQRRTGQRQQSAA